MPLQPRRGTLLHQRRNQPEPTEPITSTGQWSSPDQNVADEDLSLIDPTLEDTDEVEAEPVRTAQFVRCVTQVGNFPKGSVVPTATFEYLENLLKLGAVEYDYSATERHVTGNPEHLASAQGILQAAVQTIPNAPWFESSAHNLLGATYTSLAHTNHPWTPAPVDDSHLVTNDQPMATFQTGIPHPEPTPEQNPVSPGPTEHSLVTN